MQPEQSRGGDVGGCILPFAKELGGVMMSGVFLGGLIGCWQEAGEARRSRRRTMDLIRQRIGEFFRQLREEFGPLAVKDNACLLEAAEDWGIQLGDEFARTVIEQELGATLATPATSEEAACPQCRQTARWRGLRKRRVETRRGAIHVSEPEYHCLSCRRSFFPSDARVGDGA
jgi:hypothetical protein